MKINKMFLLFAFIAAMSCTVCFKDNKNTQNANERNFIVGIGPVWRNYQSGTSDDTIDMIKKINEVGDMLLVQNSWKDSNPSLAGQLPQYFVDVITIWPTVENPPVKYKYVSYGINFFNQGTGVAEIAINPGDPNDWTNDTVSSAKYTKVVLALCNPPYNAKYIALALEVNTYCDKTSNSDYIKFIEKVYIPTYDAIKAYNPAIKVFVTFQLEQFKGLGGSAVWGFTPNSHWLMLNHYAGKLDLIAFTSYPEFIYDTPAEIPDDYFTGIISSLPSNLKSKPLAFVETGWSDRDGNTASQQAQIDFLDRYLVLTKDLDVEYVNWVFMHDDSPAPVNPKLKLGLRDYYGNARPVWDKWKALKDKNYIE
jgi:hypothetical protein